MRGGRFSNLVKMNKTDTSHYDVLNVSPRASDEEIRQAYKTLAKVYHPDHNPNNRIVAQQRFQKISEAYSQIQKQKAMSRIKKANAAPARNDNDQTGSWLVQLAERIISSRRGAQS